MKGFDLRSYLIGIVMIVGISCADRTGGKWIIEDKNNTIIIQSGQLRQKLILFDSSIQSILLLGADTSKIHTDEFSFVLWKASPDEEPRGIEHSETGVEQQESIKNQTDALNIEFKKQSTAQSVTWVDSLLVGSAQIGSFRVKTYEIGEFWETGKRLTLKCETTQKPQWGSIKFEIVYEIYKGYPAIRKWIVIKNEGKHWIKTDHFMLTHIGLKGHYPEITHLTPAAKNADPSIIAFGNMDVSQGLILASEIPSRLRTLTDDGQAAYHPDYFEWVLGPGESFRSEPIFVYAFNGESFETISAKSTALDRCVESELRRFLKQHILLPSDSVKSVTPVFCSWTNYAAAINDDNMCVAADIAGHIGFKCFQLDAGWSSAGPLGGWAVSTTKPDTTKFPDLTSLSRYIHSKGMKSGLWYSVFINEQDAAVRDEIPPLHSIPLIKRAGGLGISFAYGKARDRYADELIYLNKTYGATYFKQDLSNICYGDIAAGHESRTLKESYLRGLRGLFASQDRIHAGAPDIFLQLSQEIYWRTPGPSGDIAVLQHADVYHIPPNEYWGAGKRSQLVNASWNLDKDSLNNKLREGCLRARNLWYAHRGLPLERLEVFGAVTMNYKGSLTADMQDRQVCSWLTGAPSSFSGDLNSLTAENIERYRHRFEIAKRLQQQYGIYSRYQYSGVPSPTDSDWHWWGKLNDEGCGAVVVLRGSEGDDSRKINIPWVSPNQKYKVKGLFADKELGVFTGKQLQSGELELSLQRFGQEIIEILKE